VREEIHRASAGSLEHAWEIQKVLGYHAYEDRDWGRKFQKGRARVVGSAPKMHILYVAIERTVTDVRKELGPLTNRVEYGGETVYVTKSGHRAAALVHPDRAALLDDLEELIDIDATRAALQAGEDTAVPFTRRTRAWDDRDA
jgi:antitoxin (DNA-binding transcriptional repressor) of toxin-antitoxin stability system